MRLNAERQERLTKALDALVDLAQMAQATRDLVGIKRALNACWFAVHDAQETLTAVDRETREEALEANRIKHMEALIYAQQMERQP